MAGHHSRAVRTRPPIHDGRAKDWIEGPEDETKKCSLPVCSGPPCEISLWMKLHSPQLAEHLGGARAKGCTALNDGVSRGSEALQSDHAFLVSAVAESIVFPRGNSNRSGLTWELSMHPLLHLQCLPMSLLARMEFWDQIRDCLQEEQKILEDTLFEFGKFQCLQAHIEILLVQ